ncbi:hypothetical protein [Phytoactinopolyspora endophytica]|uniref:hypothetical protein n=1 Tax=Phytoactinopolyspora endophytica TaxID=1642495 RepID=UPI00101B6A8E|nr:hypothetical protein [Phytoactinopolyspora endophytica]
MGSRDKRDEQRLDQVDRRSQVSISRSTRARDVSRPDATQLTEALEKLDSSGLQRFRPTETGRVKAGPDSTGANSAEKPPESAEEAEAPGSAHSD